jgi:hypothetical protein
MPINSDELRKWGETQAEDCLRYYPTLPMSEIKRIISDHLRDAYSLGFQEAKHLS